MPQHKKTDILRIISINLLVIFMLLLGLEVAARLFLYFARGRSTVGLQERIVYLDYRPFVMYGVDWQKVLDPSKYPKAKADPKTFRILLLGGSLAAGYPKEILAEAFTKRFPGRKFEVINASYGGYNARQELILASIWGPPLEPDIIISIDGANDLANRLVAQGAGTFYPNSAYELALKRPFLSPFAHLLRHSQLAQGIRRLWERRNVGSAEGYTDVIPVYISAQHSLNLLARGLPATRVMVLQPFASFKEPLSEAEVNFKWYKYRETVMKELLNLTNKELVKLAKEDSVPYGDSRFIFNGIKTTVFSDDVHFVGKEGYQILSEFIAGLVSEKDLK